jgi:hypothetical protein
VFHLILTGLPKPPSCVAVFRSWHGLTMLCRLSHACINASSPPCGRLWSTTVATAPQPHSHSGCVARYALRKCCHRRLVIVADLGADHTQHAALTVTGNRPERDAVRSPAPTSSVACSRFPARDDARAAASHLAALCRAGPSTSKSPRRRGHRGADLEQQRQTPGEHAPHLVTDVIAGGR